MRLLFDEQLSEDLATLVHDIFPDSLHVRQIDFGGAHDLRLWKFAREHGCVLVTKDEDFHRLSVLRGAPPKVIWVRLGNCRTSDVAHLLRLHVREIQRFVEQEEVTFLALG
jgi:predicted nuclease of predicted toxin-antitoxin system